ELCISSIILLSPVCNSSDVGCMTEPHLVAELFKHSLEPTTVTARLQTHYHFSGELSIEITHLFLAFMRELLHQNLSICAIAVSDGLDSRVKVYSEIYYLSHRHLLNSLCPTVCRQHCRWDYTQQQKVPAS